MQKRMLPFNNIYSRLLFFNIILILAATIIPQVSLYQYFTSQYQKKLEQSNYDNIRQVRDFTDETVFERLVSIPVTYFSDTTSNGMLMEPISHNIRNKSYDILKISKKINEIHLSYHFVSNINLYYTYNHLLFRGSHVFFLDDYDSGHGFQSPWLKDILFSEESVIWMGVDDERTACVYARTIPYFSTVNGHKAMLVIEVDKEALNNAIEKTRNSRLGVFGIVSNQGELILDIQKKTPYLTIEKDLLNRIGAQPGDGFFKSRVEGRDFIISYADSSYNDWKYISAIPVDDVFSGLFDMKIWLGILCIIFTGINIAFAVLITRKAHRPMEYIVNNISSYVSGGWLPETEKNQYRLLDNTFHSLAFQVKDLNEHLSANQPVIYHNMIKRILTSTDQSLYRDMEVIDFKKHLFVCFVVRIYHPEEMNIQNRMLINYSMNDLLNLRKIKYDVYSITDENDLLYGILNYDDDSSLQAAVNEMSQNLENSISTSFSLCMGGVTGDRQKISNSYREACEVIKYAFFYGEKQKLWYSDIKLSELSATGNSEKILRKVQTDIRGGEWNQLNKTVNSMIELVSGHVYTADYRMNTLADFVSTFRKSVIAAGYDAVGLFGGDIREQLKCIRNIGEFREWMNEIIQIVIQANTMKKDPPGGDLKLKIEEYVKNQVFNDLTLSKMSEDIGISSSYLSRIFKPIMGVNCSEYLIQAKLAKAQELLLTTDYTVKEIADKLGYSSTAHFIRIFKENFGCTPKQSRK